MATRARTPQPPLPPAASSSPTAHHRNRTFSSSSSSSSLSTASTPSPSPSPRSTTTSVPFSWEHHPGVPKKDCLLPADAASPPTPLPLPPPLRALPSRSSSLHHQHNRRRRAGPRAASDPFAVALAECTRERVAAVGSDAGLMDTLFPEPASAPSRRWSISAGGVVGFLDLYGCKSAMAVAEGAFIVRRPVAVARPGPGRAGQGRPVRVGLR
ncbi:early nodulin-20-like [Phragmites australis]|uniref:early nodulin-20-like n=1 Tax=Phragmites australis TaxID=29695 RepID=UPI002D78DBB7|nr:early nodulin-20-like [Phragmites australis]